MIGIRGAGQVPNSIRARVVSEIDRLVGVGDLRDAIERVIGIGGDGAAGVGSGLEVAAGVNPFDCRVAGELIIAD
jgi:hypothetical protein